MNLQSDHEDSKTIQERYRVFIEDVADGFYETDLRGDFIFFNDALCRIFGYSREEVQNRNYQEFMDEENARFAYEKFNHIYRTGDSFTDIMWEIIRKNGERRILEMSAKLIYSDSGEKIGFHGIARDISEKCQMIRSLEKSEELSRKSEIRYRALLDFLPYPVFFFGIDGTVSYLNPAFEKTFGWTLQELEGKKVSFVPESLKAQTRKDFRRFLANGGEHGYETKRLTKNGKLLDIILDSAVFYDDDQIPAGQVATLRDVTREKQMDRTNRVLFRIARMLPDFRLLDELLEFITAEIKAILNVEGAMAILHDPKTNEFYFRKALFDDTETGKRMQEIRFPADKGVAGHVFRTGRPLIVPDTTDSPYYFQDVDLQAEFRTRNMLDVPIRTQDRKIGVLCAVNKKNEPYLDEDVELLSAIASSIAHPIENIRINEALQRSYDDVNSLNRAKERVIHHLSHELKTPVSVLSASIGLIEKKLKESADSSLFKIMDRAKRNLKRLLDMQYKIEDILKEKDFKTHRMMLSLLDACKDEIEVLVSEELGGNNVIERIRKKIDAIFQPLDATPQKIRLDAFVEDTLQRIRHEFAHRKCDLMTRIMTTSPIHIPPEILHKIVVGLIRNAVENTPDGGRIAITVREGDEGPQLEITDYGVGITEQNRMLIFESNFSTRDTLKYTSRNPYDFNAGGKGFDLLRMKIFSERYRFSIRMDSTRCRFIPNDADLCPGDIELCDFCNTTEDCIHSGGTTMIVQFPHTSENDNYTGDFNQ